MRGLDENDPRCIKTADALADFIDELGFLPLFRNSVPGFSVEENVSCRHWWTDDPARDPWMWRMELASSGRFAYGKLFNRCAGFVSKAWFPTLAGFRRDGYDFDARADEGLARKREIEIMRLFQCGEKLSLSEIKQAVGIKTGLEATLALLQSMTYLCICSFSQRINKQGIPYGWHISVFAAPEVLWGYEHVTSAYVFSPSDCLERMLAHLHFQLPNADTANLKKLLTQ